MPTYMYGCDQVGPIDPNTGKLFDEIVSSLPSKYFIGDKNAPLSPLEEIVYNIICLKKIRSGRKGITKINKELKTRVSIIENALDSLTLKHLITISAGFWCKKEVVFYKEITHPTEHQEEVIECKNNDYGLLDKYRIYKMGSNGDWIGKKTWSFVLSPEKDDAYGAASKKAMFTYANEIEKTNPMLAEDLRKKIVEIDSRK